MLVKDSTGKIIIDTGKKLKSIEELKDDIFFNTPFSIHNYPTFFRIECDSKNSCIKHNLLIEQDAFNTRELLSKGYITKSQLPYSNGILHIVKMFKKRKLPKDALLQLRKIYTTRKA